MIDSIALQPSISLEIMLRVGTRTEIMQCASTWQWVDPLSRATAGRTPIRVPSQGAQRVGRAAALAVADGGTMQRALRLASHADSPRRWIPFPLK
jgi:hypothetical protein